MMSDHVYLNIRTSLSLVTSGLAVPGVAGNILNLVVFWRQKPWDSMTVSLTALALNDLVTLVAVLAHSLIVWHEETRTSILPQGFSYSFGWSHYMLSCSSSWIAVYIAVERCFSIAFPLKVKAMITPKVTAATLTLISVLAVASILPGLSVIRLTHVPLDTEENLTALTFTFTSDREILESLTYILVTLLQTTSFVCLFVSTIVLVVCLKRKTRWRQGVTTRPATSHSTSINSDAKSTRKRDSRVIKMVITVSTILIVCYLPSQVLNIVNVFLPEFSYQEDFSRMLWAWAILAFSVNASINVFVYYNMSSRYRQSLREMLSIFVGDVTARASDR